MNNVNAIYSSNAYPNGPFDSATSIDPAAFNYNLNPSALNASQNGPPRNMSPGFPPSYQVNQVVPAKRSHTGESMGASPRPQSMMDMSRSQTPQHSQLPASFAGSAQQFSAQSPFPHMQQHANLPQGSPSPLATNQQQFRPPFPNYQNNQRLTPQPNAQMRPNMPMGQGLSAGPFPNGPAALQGSALNPQFQDAQRQYQARLLQSQREMQQGRAAVVQPLQQNQQAQPPRLGATNAQWTGGMNGQAVPRTTAPNPNSQPPTKAQADEKAFMLVVAKFLQGQNIQINANPMVCGRPVSYYRIFSLACKILRLQMPINEKWQQIATALGFLEPSAAGEIKSLFDHNLGRYFAVWNNNMERRRMQAQQAQLAQSDQPNQMANQQANWLPNQQSQSQTQPLAQSPALSQLQSPSSSIVPPTAPRSHDSPTPVGVSSSLPADNQRKSTSAIPQSPAQQSQAHRRNGSTDMERVNGEPATASPQIKPNSPPAPPLPESTHYKPDRQRISTHGGIDVSAFDEPSDKITKYKARYNWSLNAGGVDLQPITMSLQCGFNKEATFALDQLFLLAAEGRIILRECEDLLDVLVEFGQDQVNILVNAVATASDTLQVPDFCALTKETEIEIREVHDEPSLGDAEYEIDRTIERLSAVTTILRSFSDPGNHETNKNMLAFPSVVLLLTNVIRLLGLRRHVFREARQVQTLMKDVVDLLSNIAGEISFANEDEASSVLHFFLAFAPTPKVLPDQKELMRFTPYDPNRHFYLPWAVDGLAKVLARDDPNRTYFKAILNLDANNTKPGELFTRAFALAIAPIPDKSNPLLTNALEIHMSHIRTPFFSQGMLAADILATMLSSNDNAGSIAKSWLDSEDGWAPSLMRLVAAPSAPNMRTLSTEDTNAQSHGNHQQQIAGRALGPEHQRFAIIVHRSLSMLHRLAEQADRRENGWRFDMAGWLPLEETVLNSIINMSFDGETLKQIIAFARLNSGT